mgnify:CR=1 FL=1
MHLLSAPSASCLSKEIASIEHVHANLALRHRQNEELVKQVVREKAEGLEGEMETLLRFAREKLAEIAPDAMRKVFESRFQTSEEGKDGDAGDGTAAAAAKDGGGGGEGKDAEAETEADKANEEWRLEQVRAVCCSLFAVRCLLLPGWYLVSCEISQALPVPFTDPIFPAPPPPPQLERQKALPGKNLKLIEDEFTKHKVRMEAEHAAEREQDLLRDAEKQSALSKGDNSIL